MKKTAQFLVDKKSKGEKISMLTCYDYANALMQEEAGIDMILVGDSVGTNVLGYESVREVTMGDMLHHTRAVSRGIKTGFVVGDMPYQSYETPEQAVENAKRFVENGAAGIKLEGSNFEVIKAVVDSRIPVVGHLGYTPQTKEVGLQGKDLETAKQLIKDSIELEKIGVFAMVLELVPRELAGIISDKIKIPTIGIGAGDLCDGQVLVINDMLGLNSFNFRHNKKYLNLQGQITEAFAKYKKEVEQGVFPSLENSRGLDEEVLGGLKPLTETF